MQAVAGKPHLIQSLTNVPDNGVWEGQEKNQSKRENANFGRFHAKTEWLDSVPFDNLSLVVKNSRRARSKPPTPGAAPRIDGRGRLWLGVKLLPESSCESIMSYERSRRLENQRPSATSA